MYPGAPPEALSPVRVPLHTPKQRASVDAEVIITSAGTATTATSVATHPLPSVKVTVYAPAPTA